ncbi:hypothetical protein SAMN06272771_4304 [Streptomyces sp. Ag82_O1-12]|uniref:hypothetical protein n=1 Tax=unclassified Streptomyces TaxID=2593676 RepID=UPI000BC5E565|nr:MULTISPECIES: hypothetical protein [unclassified Streptomyces]SMQ17872.1 hypothetical protein SAMN06272771_4304 [Streptomyces sp. Ag82_O1-12]SOD46910.1 hypothetical protein SAMN06272727_4303 [Streptomyces sp. Ag82_G6-1]
MSDGNRAGGNGRDRPEPAERLDERQAPTRLHGQDPKQSHAGNGTVNHGPDDQSPDGFGSDELDLRRMLHQVVQEVEPRDGTLDYLRKAVPQRRTRKRQAVVGMAAAALFIGTAIPALVHVSNATGSDANPSVAGHASETQGGASQGKGPDGGESTAGGSSGKAEGKDKGDKKDKGKGKGSGASTGASQGAGPSSTTAAGIPACTPAQLGPASGSSNAPDSTGAVSGSFRVTNVSGAACTVTGPGSVAALPQGAADMSKVGSARHAAGDAAAGLLPDPSLEAAQLVLQPGIGYDVKFAWVPSETCPTPGGSVGGPDPTPDPTPSDDPAATGGTSTGGDTGTAPQLVREDGTVDGSVAVTYTPVTGSGATSVTVSNACAGTVFWTGVLAGA